MSTDDQPIEAEPTSSEASAAAPRKKAAKKKTARKKAAKKKTTARKSSAAPTDSAGTTKASDSASEAPLTAPTYTEDHLLDSGDRIASYLEEDDKPRHSSPRRNQNQRDHQRGGGRNQRYQQQGDDRRNDRQQDRHRGGGRGPQRGRGRGPRNRNSNQRDNNQRDHQRDHQRENHRGDRDHQPGQPTRVQRERRPEQFTGEPKEEEGILELSHKGFAFLRTKEHNYQKTNRDVFITPETVRRYGLRDGLWIKGLVRDGYRGPQLTELQSINGGDPEAYRHLPLFEDLKAINPNKRIVLETTEDRHTTRVIDLMAPIGRGQRGLIVAPPRTGKTTLLQHIAEAVTEKHPDMHLMMLLVDERPEEVTELTRSLPSAEILASSNDRDVSAHTQLATMAIERAKRLVEAGEHVFMLMDSITRLGRAFNNATKGKGRTMSGGMDVRAMEIPRRLFAAARNTRDAGSLTIIATALIETGSRMDDLIFQEFKGTGNMELVLDRKISEQYTYPAVDIFKSGTRREELLLPPHQLEKIYMIRRGLAGHKPLEAIERLLSLIGKFPNNAQMLLDLPQLV